MKNIKSFFAVLLTAGIIAGGVFFSAFATDTSSGSTSSEFSAIQEYNFNFQASTDANKVKLSWSAFPAEKGFKWYKLAYSTTKENPSYPEDTSFLVSDNREKTSYEFTLKETKVFVRLCAITVNNERYCSGAKKLLLTQTQTNTGTNVEPPKMCTMEYAPVCGRPYSTCPSGAVCQIALPQTYGNLCQLNAEKAELLYKGECKNETPKPTPVACTMEYAPVCGQSPAKTCMGPDCASEQKTYSNTCMLNADNAKFLYKGECKTEPTKLPERTKTKYYVGDTNKCMMIKYTCETGWSYFADDIGCGCQRSDVSQPIPSPKPSLPVVIQKQLQSIIQEFLKKLEAKNYDEAKKIETINMVIQKLEVLAKQDKYAKMAQYCIELLEKALSNYENNLGIFEDIFKDF